MAVLKSISCNTVRSSFDNIEWYRQFDPKTSVCILVCIVIVDRLALMKYEILRMSTNRNNYNNFCTAHSLQLGNKGICYILIFNQSVSLLISSTMIQDCSDWTQRWGIHYELTGHPPSGNASDIWTQKRNIPPWYTPCRTKSTPNHTENKSKYI